VYLTPTPGKSNVLAALPQSQPTLPAPVSEPSPIPATATHTPIPPTNTPVIAPTQDEPLPEATPFPTSEQPPILYYTQSGDSLSAIAMRFDVKPDEISSSNALPQSGLIDPGILLVIPDQGFEHGPNAQIMPDSEIVFSVTGADFDIYAYISESGGELSKYREYLGSAGRTTGAQAIERISIENSVNPRLLLALLDHEGNWVTGSPNDYLHTQYPMGFESDFEKGIFRQMVLAVNQLQTGYYGWRSGTLTELTFPNGEKLRLAPDLNAGTVAIQYLFSKLYNRTEWQSIIDPNVGFPAFYAEQLGDPWQRAQNAGPIFPPGLTQPNMVLPFEPNREWAFTGGPHGAWEHEGPLAAIDFAPATDKSGCTESEKWLVAAAPGLVVRSGNGVVVLDLDGDGYEETGWNLLYLHVASKERIKLDTWAETDNRIGHASCEGGVSTGTHLHFARKYNGEWVLADGPLPFVLSGYTVRNGSKPYLGTLEKGETVIVANETGTAGSTIFRKSDE
jgi:murein DD-endopeptidase MepM/ murein hydrolase activator NlpD